jgi:phosphohistidine phosphatase SixA
MALVAGLSTPVARAETAATPEALIAAMQDGGKVIYIRHVQTEVDYADQVFANPQFCQTQRALGREGWADAKAIGAAFRDHGIPVGDVLSSEFCRAWQTADLAFGRFTTDPALNFLPTEDYTEAEVATMRDRVLPLLAAEVPAGTNRVIVGHDDPFEAATGLYPEPQGIVVVLQPDGAGGAKILGSLAPDAWPAP